MSDTETTNQPEKEQKPNTSKEETIVMLVILGIIGLVIGYYCNTERIPDLQVASTLATPISLFLLSGIVSLLFRKNGKWRLAFIITFCLIGGSMVFNTIYEKSKRPKQPEPKFYIR